MAMPPNFSNGEIYFDIWDNLLYSYGSEIK